MVEPSSVGLLIFDLDGTILLSGRAVYESVKRALPKMGIGVVFDEEYIKGLLAMSAEQFYRGILPADKQSLWQEVREAVHREYDDALAKYACGFPDVVETLNVLKQRGYRLALYSYSHSGYIKSALVVMGIPDCFDYVESVQDTDINKIKLVRKIKNKLKCDSIAVIGDSINDIDAAGANGALAVGALYGYGSLKAEQADIAINSFSELLDVFDRKYE
jgi:phosphoglycolate phosphatase